MNVKKEIFGSVQPPEPKGRDGFLKALPYPKLTYPEFVLLQIGYIRKRVWLVSAAVLLAGIGTVCVMPENGRMIVWIMSALIPFLAVLTAAEISRSDVFGMSEIEAGCRFALPQITGARMIILGVCNFAVISVVTVLTGIFSPFGIAKSALYILMPYVFVCGISLTVFDRERGQDGVFISGAAALAVSLAGVILDRSFYGGQMMNVLNIALCAVGAVMMTVKIKKLLVGKDNYYGIKD
ncbi:MAG: hypothetical protein NC395_02385 [Prevotella sp.]|nr:hypothetical protein [Prevotella sp.]